MSLNIPNLNKLIAHLEAQPPERINMYYISVRHHHECGTCGCIAGHADLLGSNGDIEKWLGLPMSKGHKLIMPKGYKTEKHGARRYPACRVIATLKRLRDHFLATGEVKVDWGPEPGGESAKPWSAPQAVEARIVPPELPASIIALLSPEKASA